MPHFFHIDDLSLQRSKRGKSYLEYLRVQAMSAGIYVLPKGGADPQKPHREDEPACKSAPGTPRCRRVQSFSLKRNWSIVSMTSRKNSRFWSFSPPPNKSEREWSDGRLAVLPGSGRSAAMKSPSRSEACRVSCRVPSRVRQRLG